MGEKTRNGTKIAWGVVFLTPSFIFSMQQENRVIKPTPVDQFRVHERRYSSTLCQGFLRSNRVETHCHCGCRFCGPSFCCLITDEMTMPLWLGMEDAFDDRDAPQPSC